MSSIVQLIPLSGSWAVRFTYYKKPGLDLITDIESFPLIAWALTETGKVEAVYVVDLDIKVGLESGAAAADDDEHCCAEYFQVIKT